MILIQFQISFLFFKNESEENYIVALNYSNGQYEDSFKNLKIWANSLSEDIKVYINYLKVYLNIQRNFNNT